jgi:predicted hotdog family 3-hydroxylacyl-ACP dehydratase
MTKGEIVRLPVLELLPLALPMSLIDRNVAMTDETFETEVAIRPDSLFCDGARVGAWVGMEYMAQTIGLFANAEHLERGEPISAGFLLGSREYRCRVPFFSVGSTLRITATKLIHDPSGLGVLECRLREAGAAEPLVTANLTLFEVPDLEKFLKETLN